MDERKPVSTATLWTKAEEYVCLRADAATALRYESVFHEQRDYFANALNMGHASLDQYLDPSVVSVSQSVHVLHQDSMWQFRKARFANLSASVLRKSADDRPAISPEQREIYAKEMFGQMIKHNTLAYHMAEIMWSFSVNDTLDPLFMPRHADPADADGHIPDAVAGLGRLCRQSAFIATHFDENMKLLVRDEDATEDDIKNAALRADYRDKRRELLISGSIDGQDQTLTAPPGLYERITQALNDRHKNKAKFLPPN